MSDDRFLKFRALLLHLGMAAFAVAVAVKLFRIQLVEGEHWRARAAQVATAWHTVQPDRGNILADDGRLLATTVSEYEVRVDMVPRGLTDALFEKHIAELARHLAELWPDRSAEQWRRELTEARRRKRGYHLLRRRATHQEVRALKTFPLFDQGPNVGGLIPVKHTRRTRPFGRLAERTIGKVPRDTTLRPYGLEGGFDAWLRGTTGRRFERRLAGNVWMPMGEGVDPVPGADIHTTIDINLQDVADAALEAQLRKHGAQYGCVVVMEVATGHVKAISNLTRQNDSTYVEDLNYAVGHVTEPGSTFKLAALMAGIEDGLIEPTDTVDTRRGVVSFHGEKMRDAHEGGHGRITVQRAFELSSNTGISQAVTKAYGRQPRRFVEALKRMGLHEPLGVSIPGEDLPVLRSPGDKGWSGLSIPWMSIGYEVALTPLQVLAFYNAVANGGRLVQPRFVTGASRDGRMVQRFGTVTLRERICSDRTLAIARAMLQGVVDSGTAVNLRGAHFPIAGKTGTAQVARNGSYKQHGVSYQASFVGWFPADAPKYSCIVVVNGPTTSGYYGNVVAGPIFKEIADKVHGNRLELHRANPVARSDEPPVSFSGHADDLRTAFAGLAIRYLDDAGAQWVSTQAGDSAIALRARALPDALRGVVPNVLDMGLRDALYLLEHQGLRVRVAGSGRVKRQSLPPGTRAPQGATILIELA